MGRMTAALTPLGTHKHMKQLAKVLIMLVFFAVSYVCGSREVKFRNYLLFACLPYAVLMFAVIFFWK